VRMRFHRRRSDGQDGMLADREKVRLILRPDIEDRNFHENTKAYTGPEHEWPGAVEKHPRGFSFAPRKEHPLHVGISEGSFVWEPEWRYMVHHPIEAERGLDPDSDLFSPGYFLAHLQGGGTIELTARIGETMETVDATSTPAGGPDSTRQEDVPWKLGEAVEQALDHYVVNRGEGKTVIAGYPWFLDWGRDALIFARGLAATGRTDDARAIVRTFGQYERNGTIPNMIRGGDTDNRDTSDAPLWFVLACADIMHAEGDKTLLDFPCGDRTIREALLSIARSYVEGTSNGIRMDDQSGLIFSPSHFTWMDTNHPAGTPREGYPIEIQALWFAALEFLETLQPGNDWGTYASAVQTHVAALFSLKDTGYLADCLYAAVGTPPRRAEPDDALRPNQLFAVTLGAVSDTARCRGIVAACQQLIVPGAIRSLADRPVRRPLRIEHRGRLLNDPSHPYQGRYSGDEDTQRKPAYHNGTAWTWVFPAFCEAWAIAYGQGAKPTARAWLASCARLMNSGCLGHLPEILDGDSPHRQRGCDAQAWGASEALRVWKWLQG